MVQQLVATLNDLGPSDDFTIGAMAAATAAGHSSIFSTRSVPDATVTAIGPDGVTTERVAAILPGRIDSPPKPIGPAFVVGCTAAGVVALCVWFFFLLVVL
jgi:hypothetical protein